MNYKIFIEYENSLLNNLSKSLYDLFLENNYDVILLDNTITFNEKEKIIKESNNKNIIISNKINDNNTFEIVYSLLNTNELALSINNILSNYYTISKYYQRRDTTNTNLDYYKILRNINNNESIIIFYPPNVVNNLSINNYIYEGITNYLNEQNIYIVKSGDNLYSISKKYNVSIDELKEINNIINNNLSIGQKLFIPSNMKQENEQQNDSTNTYIVKSGDSLYAIAKRFNTSVDEIKKLNNLTSNNLSINQKLFIPNNNEQSSNYNTYIVKSGDNLYAIAKKFNTSIDEIKKLNNLTSNNLSINQKLFIPSYNEQSNTTYTVKLGDSLYSIAKKYNTSVDEIKRINNLNSNLLSINQKLIIP